jgi:hypothetical protein
VRAVLEEGFGVGATHAARGAGDDHDPISDTADFCWHTLIV